VQSLSATELHITDFNTIFHFCSVLTFQSQNMNVMHMFEMISKKGNLGLLKLFTL